MGETMQQCKLTLVSAMFALVFVAASTGAVGAAKCIAKPDAQAPQGEHWYYRTDRATKRQCWYLGPESADIQKSATEALKQTSNALTLPAAPPHAQRPTAKAPEAGRAATATEASVPAPPPPWPEAAKLPDVPPSFEPTPTPVPAERQQSVDAIDPAPTPTSEKSQSPANARSSPASAPAQSTADGDHTLALAMIVFAAIVISGSVFEVTRWLNRRKASTRHRLEWAHPSTSNTPYPLARTSLDFNSGTPARRIPPPPKPLEQEEKELAQALQQLLNETQTKQPVKPLDRTEQLAQALQQVLNETQTKQHGPRLTPNIVRDRVSRRAELHQDQPASATDRDGTLESMDLLLANQRN